MDHVLTGDEHIMYDGMPINYLLRDFWAWSSSDLLNNTLRGSFAEFLVCAACGLKATLLTPREDWSPYDVYYPLLPGKKGIRIEVKSAAYLQAWENDKLSRIQFSIRPTRAWSSSGGYEDAIRHQSDVYVFCVYANKDRASANPLVLDDWDFYVLSTLAISSRCGSQQSISLSALKDLGPRKVKFDGIEQAILECYKIPEFTPPPPQNDQFMVSDFVQSAKGGAPAADTGTPPSLSPLVCFWSCVSCEPCWYIEIV